MSLEIRHVDELAVHVADGTISGVDVLNTSAGLSDADIPSCDATSTVDLEIEEPEEHETEYPSEITCANLSRPDSMIDHTGSPSNFAAESERPETTRFEEFETMPEAEVSKNIVELCSVDINAGSPSDAASGPIPLEFEEGEEVRTRTYVEVARADPIVHEPLTGNNGAGGLSDVVTATSATRSTEEAIKEGNCVEELVVHTGVGDSTMDANGGGGLEELVHDTRLGDIREEAFKEGDHVKKLVFDVVVGDTTKANLVPHEEGNQVPVNTAQTPLKTKPEEMKKKSVFQSMTLSIVLLKERVSTFSIQNHCHWKLENTLLNCELSRSHLMHLMVCASSISLALLMFQRNHVRKFKLSSDMSNQR
uniref:Uncharacterized protein n=1 Tax=Physcomitrium patens TaxID=3218 RepID=A0A2K1ID92_PHYPA|nr:hypothetical protein PHYPA_029397 [Physcomitrium patens]